MWVQLLSVLYSIQLPVNGPGKCKKVQTVGYLPLVWESRMGTPGLLAPGFHPAPLAWLLCHLERESEDGFHSWRFMWPPWANQLVSFYEKLGFFLHMHSRGCVCVCVKNTDSTRQNFVFFIAHVDVCIFLRCSMTSHVVFWLYFSITHDSGPHSEPWQSLHS